MKKVCLLTLFAAFTAVLLAQTNNRTAAFNHLRYGRLDKAKQAIDLAAAHPNTMNDAKTWFYYGNVYLAIHLSDNPDYKKLDANALDKAYNAYLKAKELDVKKEHAADIKDRLTVCAEQYFNQGVASYNRSDFVNASKLFQQAAGINASLGITDTLSYFYAAQSAYFGNQLEQSKDLFNQLLAMNYKEPAVFRFLSEIYKNENNLDKALQIVKEGRKIHPDDFGLIIEETNIYLATDQREKAMELLQIAIQRDQTNPTLYFAVGTQFEQMGDFKEAEKNYKRAIELNPDYFDANYNLGALYVNKAIELSDDANNLPFTEQVKFEELRLQADEFLRKSIPYLEKADELNPGDIVVLRTLRDIYVRLNMYDKIKEIDAKLHKK